MYFYISKITNIIFKTYKKSFFKYEYFKCIYFINVIINNCNRYEIPVNSLCVNLLRAIFYYDNLKFGT